MEQVYFTADLHIHHINILSHQNNRVKGMGLKSKNDITTHDAYIMDILKQVKPEDRIYFLGDTLFGNRQDAVNMISKVKGNKYFINGNHDAAFNQMDNYFKWKGDIKQVTFQKDLFPFLKTDIEVCLCHYPLISWPRKSYGSILLYGHVHANSLFLDDTDDLMLNVGIDNPKSHFNLFTLESVYEIIQKKLKGLTPRQYIDKVTKENDKFVR